MGSVHNQGETLQHLFYVTFELFSYYFKVKMPEKITISYWKCRGYVEAIRLTLEYCGLDYEFVGQESGPAPLFGKAVWLAKKNQLLKDFDFPNLPYFDDGKVKLTQHRAILQYLARNNGLEGKTDEAKLNVDLIREHLGDIEKGVLGYVYDMGLRNDPERAAAGPSLEAKKAKKKAYMAMAEPLLGFLEKKVAKTGGPWCAGADLTYVDFQAFEDLSQIQILLPELFTEANYPKLSAFLKAFANLDRIKSYLNSGRFNKFPLWSERAYIGLNEENSIVPL